MNAYREFVDNLQKSLATFTSFSKEKWEEEAIRYVDGLAAEELRRLINLETRKRYGAFFTNSDLAKKLLDAMNPCFNGNSVIYDPACGAGNLLISIYNFLTKNKINPNSKILGTDIHKEFVEASKLRLQINEILKTSSNTSFSKFATNEGNFNILIKDGLLKNDFFEMATHIVVNPPFNSVNSNKELTWANGKVSLAAIFIEKIIQNSNGGTTIIAILPDVLRSGSRYEKWRKIINSTCKLEKIKLLGQFDKFADVDVFAIKLVKREKPIDSKKSYFTSTKKPKRILQNLFDICVGTVVDNRDPFIGNEQGYVVSKGLLGWGEEKEIVKKRKHQGKSFKSPFVVIKRTSRMGDSNRAIATIINDSNPLFVDNHLIVLKPKSGKIDDCRFALEILQKKETDDWLNNQIRCRHLTVKIVSQIPI